MIPDPIRQSAITAVAVAQEAHVYEPYATECRCGLRGSPFGHLAHTRAAIADAVLAAVTEPLMRAGGERELREAAGAYLHDYPEIRDDLIARADRLADAIGEAT